MVFEETELRLGLPGNGGGGGFDEGGGHDHVQQQVVVAVMMRKRGFSETETETETADERESSDESSDNAVDLKLNLSNSNNNNNNNKDILLQAAGANHHHNDHKTTANMVMHNKEKNLLPSDPANPPAAKAQVVGWPPVRSFRKNMMAVQKSSAEESEKLSPGSAVLVKVSMDGAPYLRKVDLNMYKNYQELSDALGKMFSSFSTIGNCGSQGMKDFMNESKLMDVLNGSDYVPTYEDKDGDWMLVGDVPWEMFVESCKRLRIMKGKEAVGLAPRAMEKCKNRS